MSTVLAKSRDGKDDGNVTSQETCLLPDGHAFAQ